MVVMPSYTYAPFFLHVCCIQFDAKHTDAMLAVYRKAQIRVCTPACLHVDYVFLPLGP